MCTIISVCSLLLRIIVLRILLSLSVIDLATEVITGVSAGLLGLQGSLLVSSIHAWSPGVSLGLQKSLLVSSALPWSPGVSASVQWSCLVSRVSSGLDLQRSLLISISGGPCWSPLVSRCLCWSAVSHLVSRCYCWSPLIFRGLC